MKQLHASFTFPFNITKPKHSHIKNLDSNKNNCQSFDSSCDKFCVRNGGFSIEKMMINRYILYSETNIPCYK